MNTSTENLDNVAPRVRDYAKNIAGELGVEGFLMPCIEAYIFNSIMLGIVWDIRKGKDINVDKHVQRVRKLLSEKDRAKRLESVCRLYIELLRRNPRVVADIGCGLGLNLVITKSYIGRPLLLLGVDKDLYFLKILKKIHRDVEAIQADASMLPLRNGSVDIVFTTGVIHELPSLKAINEFKRVLKSNGNLLIGDVVLRHVPSVILNIIRFFKTKLGIEPETPYTLKQLYSKIRQLGMRIENINVFWRSRVIGSVVIVATRK
ncbi:class I SAM-dependent methyltransferase [Desulfurococcaceae archaeon MEX13E-LK6-19]|nr:class I SAM-dependent methyltransferase [Desulfurococcaceae archaeon MEX13E-LK6-19]